MNRHAYQHQFVWSIRAKCQFLSGVETKNNAEPFITSLSLTQARISIGANSGSGSTFALPPPLACQPPLPISHPDPTDVSPTADPLAMRGSSEATKLCVQISHIFDLTTANVSLVLTALPFSATSPAPMCPVCTKFVGRPIILLSILLRFLCGE